MNRNVSVYLDRIIKNTSVLKNSSNQNIKQVCQ